MMPLKTKVVHIGNALGVRIPKTLLGQCHFHGKVELERRGNYLILRSAKKPRVGWNEAFRAMAKQGDDKVIIGDVLPENKWDKDKWKWEKGTNRSRPNSHDRQNQTDKKAWEN